MVDYALWKVLENSATLPKTQVVEGATTVMPITSVEYKAQRRLEVKARSTLMMGIPNEHQLKLNSIKDAKQLLSPEWNTYAVVWRNKADLETISMDDLYNNLKVHEPEVKGISSSNSSTQTMDFVSSSNNNNTNGAVNTGQAVNTANGCFIFLFMRTRRSYFPPANTIPRHSRRKSTSLVESDIQTNATMADNRTMAQMLQAPIEGYEDAIVAPPINANNFELKQTLINLVQSNQFTGRQDSHNHLRFFNKVTSTFRHPEVPNTTLKLLLFPFSLEGEARIWLDKEPPRSILTWKVLVSKFVNQLFPLSKTTYLRNEITNFLQKSNETFNEAWEHFKDLLRQCPHHGFSELHQPDTFYNALNPNDQDALDSAAGGNFLDKISRECLSIIESKSKFRYLRSRVTDVRTNANATLSSSQSNSFDLQQIAAALEDKLDIRMNRFEKSLNEMKNCIVTPTAPLKAVTEVCVTCGSNHSYNQCPLTRGGNDFPVFHDNIQQFQTAAVVTQSQIRREKQKLLPPGV
nr:reverse transcriptase domain-containing protein [Tanacetum cinerariifolium]